MKIRCQSSKRTREGTAVIVIIALLALLLIFIAGNLRTVELLRRDLRLIERQQTNRLATASLSTNSAAVSNAAPASIPSAGAPGTERK